VWKIAESHGHISADSRHTLTPDPRLEPVLRVPRRRCSSYSLADLRPSCCCGVAMLDSRWPGRSCRLPVWRCLGRLMSLVPASGLGGLSTTLRREPDATVRERARQHSQPQSAASGTLGGSLPPAGRCPLSKHRVRQSKRRVCAVSFETNRLGAMTARRKSAVAPPAQISPRVPLKPLCFAVYARLDFHSSRLFRQRAGLAFFA
jgi:hypothetical protein